MKEKIRNTYSWDENLKRYTLDTPKVEEVKKPTPKKKKTAKKSK